MRLRLPAIALLLLFALSGCAAEGQGQDPTAGPDVALEPSDEETVSASSPSSASAASAEPRPSPSPTPSSPAAAPAAQPVNPDPVVLSCDLGTIAAVGDGGAPWVALFIKQSCSPGVPESASGGPFRSAVVEMAWTNAAPTLVKAGFSVSDGERQLGHVDGTTSPLRLVLSGESFPEGPSPDLVGSFRGTGAYALFDATLTFSYFETAQPPDGYSAA